MQFTNEMKSIELVVYVCAHNEYYIIFYGQIYNDRVYYLLTLLSICLSVCLSVCLALSLSVSVSLCVHV